MEKGIKNRKIKGRFHIREKIASKKRKGRASGE